MTCTAGLLAAWDVHTSLFSPPLRKGSMSRFEILLFFFWYWKSHSERVQDTLLVSRRWEHAHGERETSYSPRIMQWLWYSHQKARGFWESGHCPKRVTQTTALNGQPQRWQILCAFRQAVSGGCSIKGSIDSNRISRNKVLHLLLTTHPLSLPTLTRFRQIISWHFVCAKFFHIASTSSTRFAAKMVCIT